MIERYVRVITLHTLGSVHRTFLTTDNQHRHRSDQPFDTFVTYEAFQAEYSAISITFDDINRCLLDQKLDAWSPMVYIYDQFQFGPHTSGPPSMYKSTKKSSFFGRLVPEATLYIAGTLCRQFS